MKIDIGATLERLTHLQRQMGATEEPELPAAILESLGAEGVLVKISELPVLPEGVLRWRGQIVVLYIRDQHAWGGQVAGYRFHVAECGTIETMRWQGRGDRYVVTNRSDGTFPVRAGSYGELKLLPMSVCKNCLSRLDWDGYRTADHRKRDKIVATFDIAEFFSTYRNTSRPLPRTEAPNAAALPQPGTGGPAQRWRLSMFRPSGGPAGGTAPPTGTAPTGTAPTGTAPTRPPSVDESERWAYSSIEDAQFRQVALHIQLYGSISESEVHEMVEGARRARRFGLSLDEWFRGAPFRVEVRSVLGVKSYYRLPR